MGKHNQTWIKISTSQSKYGPTEVAEKEVHDKYWIRGFYSENREAHPVGTFCPTFSLVPVWAPSTPHHHVLGILWLHKASACDTRTSNQVYSITRSRVSQTVNDMSWTKSNCKATWGLPRIQKQTLIFIMTVISYFLVAIVQVARSISSCCKLLVFKMIFFL